VNMDGYNVVVNKESKNQNDGVIVFVKKCIVMSSDEVSMFGATCVRVDITLGGEQVSLLCVYRSPSCDLSLFIDDLETYLDNRSGGRTHWLVGDINCCIVPETNNALSQRYIDVMYGAGFVSCINVPTRVTEFSTSCIDHIFTDMRNTSNVKSVVIKSTITDHYLVVAQFNSIISKNNKLKQETDILNYRAAAQLISGVDWSEFNDIADAELGFALFIDKLQNIIKLSTKTVRTPSKFCNIKPWITPGIVRSVRTRDEMGRRLKTQPFNTVLKLHFKRYRNTLSKIIKTAKNNYYHNKIYESADNKIKLWNNISEIMGIKKCKDSFPVKHFLRGKECIEVGDIINVANTLNNYYVGVGANLAKVIPPASEVVVEDGDYVADSNFQLEPISEAQLVQVVNKLKGGSAPGVDQIPAKLIKGNLGHLKSPLLHLVNTSLLTGVFPKCFKTGKVIPIYKGGDKSNCVSFRPITLASVVAKVIEKCVKCQLENYLISNYILYENQFGFRKDKNINDDLFFVNKEYS
jgi:hypothetical protein